MFSKDFVPTKEAIPMVLVRKELTLRIITLAYL